MYEYVLTETSVNIDRRERFQGRFDGELGEWFFEDHHDDLLEMFREKTEVALPQYAPFLLALPSSYAPTYEYCEFAYRKMKKRLIEGRRVTQRAKLFMLPFEVLDLVLEELSSARDHALMYFAITCKDLLDIAEYRIIEFYKKSFLVWRDCRVICVGHYLDEDDELPAGVLTEAERAWIASEREWGNCYGIFMAHFTDQRQRKSCPPFSVPHGYTSVEQDPFQTDNNMVRELYEHEPVSVSSRADKEILCNISKREYVRDLALYDPEIPMCVTLAHALITLICWSSVVGYRLQYNIQAVRDMKRGRWAGDRFRIVTEGALSNFEDGGWTDISEEVGVILRHLVKENPDRLKRAAQK